MRRNAGQGGLSTTPEYQAWRNMIARCEDVGNVSFADYGGRGITVCERWHDFLLFYADMGPRPSRGIRSIASTTALATPLVTAAGLHGRSKCSIDVSGPTACEATSLRPTTRASTATSGTAGPAVANECATSERVADWR